MWNNPSMAEATPTPTSSRPPGPFTEKLGYVDESDIDLVLVLDAHRRGPVLEHLLSEVGLSTDGEVRATRSALRNGGTRETDVEVCWNGGALLIEDKIDSGFTPGQPQSYVDEVELRARDGERAAALLVCPGRSLHRYRAGGGTAFTYVTCEALADSATAAGDSQSLATAMVLLAAAERPPGPVTDPLAVLWGEGYRAVVAAVTPPGELVKFAKTSFRQLTSDWVKLLLVGFPSGADGPWHWLSRGLVSVYLTTEPNAGTLPQGGVVVKSGKGWRLDIAVSPVRVDIPASEQVHAIAESVTAAVVLRHWCGAHLNDA